MAGRKRFIVTDTLGLLITVTVCAGSVQDRDGAKGTLLGLVDWARQTLRTTLSVVRKPADQKGFAVLPRRGRSSGRWHGLPATAGSPVTMNATHPPAKR